MMAGCFPGSDQAAKPLPVSVDLARSRCPDADARYAEEFSKIVPPPKSAGLPEDVAKEKIDEFRVAVDLKNRLGQSLLRDYRACQNKTPARVPAS